MSLSRLANAQEAWSMYIIIAFYTGLNGNTFPALWISNDCLKKKVFSAKFASKKYILVWRMKENAWKLFRYHLKYLEALLFS